MTQERPFRFGVTDGRADTAKAWRRLARRTEALGYTTLFLPDHFNDQLAPIPALAMAAEATRDLRVGTLVLCNDFRSPAMATKELATLDLLTDGRVEWGMGAGWFPPDYASTGLRFDAPAVRVRRLDASIAIMKQLFADGPASADDEDYRIDELEGTPKPVQRPHPPLLIGGSRRRLLELAARQADIVGIAPSTDCRSIGSRPPLVSVTAATDRQVGWLRNAAGSRYADLELQMVAFPTAVDGDVGRLTATLASSWGVDEAEVRATPHVLAGSIDEICDRLQERRARWGVSYWVVAAGAAEAFAPVVERLHGT